MEEFTFLKIQPTCWHCWVFGASMDHIWSRWSKVLFLKLGGEDSVTVTIFEATCHEKGLIRHCWSVNTKHSLRPPEAMSASPLTFFKGVTEASLQSALGSYLFIYFLFVCLFFEESRKSDTETLPKALAVSFQEFKERNRNTLKTPRHRNPHTPKEVTLDPRNITAEIFKTRGLFSHFHLTLFH